MPIFKKTWYHAKKPLLQIAILKQIALFGELSKICTYKELQLSKFYPDISDAFKALHTRRLIAKSNVNFKSRRPEQYYKLTDKGFEVFIGEEPTPKEFWKAMICFCRLNTKRINNDKFETFYGLFERSYLGYSSEHGYFFYDFSHFIDKLFDKWIEDNRKKNIDDLSFEEISPSQKVFECLALNRSLTFEELVRMINVGKGEEYKQLNTQREEVENISNLSSTYRHFIEIESDPEEKKSLRRQLLGEEDKEDIKKVLNEYTLSSSCHRRADDTENPDEIIEGYVEYIKHFVIIPKYDKGIIRYELSLFGIALVLNILEYCYNFEKNFNTPVIYPMVISLRRFCHNYQVKDYYENIALGYPEKIPLIFGKWNIIKKSLSHNELLTNAFSILVNKNRRMNIMSLPFTMGGFKEHYTSIQALAYNTTQKLGKIYDDCQDALQEDRDEHQNESIHYNLFYQKLKKLRILLNFSDLTNVRSGSLAAQSKRDFEGLLKEEVGLIENIYANEITFLFYLIISGPGYYDYASPPDNIYKTYFPSQTEESTEEEKSHWYVSNLPEIVENDKDIQPWFSTRIEASREYRKEAYDIMCRYYEQLTKN